MSNYLKYYEIQHTNTNFENLIHYLEGYKDGKADGEEYGYDDGYTLGHTDGYQEAKEEFENLDTYWQIKTRILS